MILPLEFCDVLSTSVTLFCLLAHDGVYFKSNLLSWLDKMLHISADSAKAVHTNITHSFDI